MSNKAAVLISLVGLLSAITYTSAGPQDCAAGYEFQRRFIKCVQSDCYDVEHAHLSYTGDCVCGSSGSINENPEDPNKECSMPLDHASCPNCVYACVHLDEPCPGEKEAEPEVTTTAAPTPPAEAISPEEEACAREWAGKGAHVIGLIDDYGECVGGCELGWRMEADGCRSCDEICPKEEPGTIFSREDSKDNKCVCIETEETEQQKMERAIARNLVDYLAMKNRFLEDLKDLQDEADSILEQIREAEWFLRHGTDEEKAQAKKDLERLYDEQDRVLEEFEERAATLYDILDRMGQGYYDYEHHDEYQDYLSGLRGELDMTHLNMALRVGDTEEFDNIFNRVRTNTHVRPQALTANAFRQLMEGDTRNALHSARRALEADPDNPMAQRLIQNIEMAYLERIRDRLSQEQSNTARLFNDKLNKHGEQGVGSLLIDIATTGVGESFNAIAGYYDILGDLQDLQVDEATRQIAGIRLIEDLREGGVTFEEMSALTDEGMKALILEEYGRELTDEQARRLRQRIYDGFRNVDVNAIRNGDLSQYDIDVGRDYFDSEILQFNEADLVNRQFSAWDTFLTFAPSAHLGRLSNLQAAQRLGLTAQSTLQQSMQAAFRVEQLGRSIYQTRSGAAIIDGLHQLNGYERMVAEAVKNHVGEAVYAAGSTAVRQYITQTMSGPAKKKLQEEILRISDHYLGYEATGAIEGTLNAMSGVFNFIGLNQQALMRGAYGVERMERIEGAIMSERTREGNAANNIGVARASSRPRNFQDFKRQVQGDSGYLEDVRDARSRVSSISQDNNPRRRGLLSQADQTLQHEERAAQLLSQGDEAGARQAFNQMVRSQSQLSTARGESLRRLGELNGRMQLINEFRSPPVDVQTVGTWVNYVNTRSAGDQVQEGSRDLHNIGNSVLQTFIPKPK
jgi:hypothetical protein